MSGGGSGPGPGGGGPIPVVVHGAAGRMGRLVADLVDGATDCALVALVDAPDRTAPAGAVHPDLPVLGQERLGEATPRGGVIVDFSVAGALDGLLAGAAAAGAALVVGTTGHDEAGRERLRGHAGSLPVVLAANFSLGIPALRLALELLARVLPPGFAAEEVETHHRHKLDRPSGTALWLADGWSEARGGARPPIHSLRLGGVVGEHAWTISDDEETLELTHRAHSRRAFLRGVLPAVRFVAGRGPGLYGLTDVLREALPAGNRAGGRA